MTYIAIGLAVWILAALGLTIYVSWRELKEVLLAFWISLGWPLIAVSVLVYYARRPREREVSHD